MFPKQTSWFFTGVLLSAAVFAAFTALEPSCNDPKQDANDVRIAQHQKCLDADMESVLEEGQIVCSPNSGYDSIKNHFAKKQAAYLIGKSEEKPQKKDPKWPADPDSFETKSKRTE